jgi:yersiniabactin nonribosomal peptide synthetase
MTPQSGATANDSAARRPEVDYEQLRQIVARVLELPTERLDAEAELTQQGMDSLRAMAVASALRAAGLRIKFSDLLSQPTLIGWWEIVVERQRVSHEPATARIDLDEHAPFELNAMQRAHWLGRAAGQALSVGCHFYFEFDGTALDHARLDQAARALVARHPMLRACFVEGRQRIGAHTWRGVQLHDLRELPESAVANELLERREELSRLRMDVEQGQVIDLQLSLLPGGRSRLHLNIDMLVSDARSFQIVTNDLAQLYAEPEQQPQALDYSFARYLAELTLQRKATFETAQAYWKERGQELPGPPRLPLSCEPQLIADPRPTRRHHWLPPERTRVLLERGRACGVSLPMVFAAAFAEVLARWSSEPEFLLNVPLFDRERLHPAVDRLVGDFTNLVLLAVDTREPASFEQRARALQDRLWRDAAHADYSGVEILRDLARAEPGAGIRAPVVFTSALSMGELFDPRVRAAFGEVSWMISQTSQVWLDCQVIEHAGAVLVNWDAVAQLFAEGVLDAMFGAYLRLLEALSEPDAQWSKPGLVPLPPLQVARRAEVNATAAPRPTGLLHDGFFHQAAAHPERPALLRGDERECSYAELARRAENVAAAVSAHVEGLGARVAVTLPKGESQIAAVLGVLRAGCTYVPVGLDQPPQRRVQMYQAACARLVLYSRAEDLGAIQLAGCQGLRIEDALQPAPEVRAQRPSDSALAYIIFTSGSTGVPKGVMISHQAALNTVAHINRRFQVCERDRVLAVSALEFDLSVYDIFGVLAAGGALVLVEEAERREPRRWLELARRWNVTLWNSVPALLEMLSTVAAARGISSNLRLALVSGDWVPTDLAARVRSHDPDCRVVALGGATEAAIWSNAFEIRDVPRDWRSIPYGHPLPNQRFRVVDSRGRDCPDWVAGELWIGGAGVADGYCGDAQTTASKFVEHAGERWYRTGDLGRYWPDGTLEFLGRVDFQLKIRGHRIELNEIEATLESHPSVSRAIVIATEQPALRLTACLQLAAAVAPSALKTFVANRLPSWEVPAAYLEWDEYPLSSNGKIDRKELARRVAACPTAITRDAPRPGTEATLAAIWCDVLRRDSLDRQDSFFDLGGDSLLATRVLEAIAQRCAVQLALRHLFSSPTIAELALVLESVRAETTMVECEEGAL